jgi:cytochrome c-type biogenesis protein CcmF
MRQFKSSNLINMHMNLGTLLIWLSFLFCLIALFRLKSIACEIGVSICLTLASLLLFYYLIAVDYSYLYVLEYSSFDMPWYYRISAFWAGQAGSILLWAWFISIVYLAFNLSNKHQSSNLLKIAKTSILLVNLFFISLLMINSPFEPTPSFYSNIEGRGLNPLLMNFWMGIHPPVVFAGYALLTIPYGASIGYIYTKDKRWIQLAKFWTRLAWLFLTLGIGLGGFWAYEELGWGGYWTWDPVETSSLIPWITTTALLHTQTRFNLNEYRVVAPMLSISTFASIIFSTFLTRGGAQFAFNPHGWESSNVGPAILIFLLAVVISGVYLILKHLKEGE